MVLRTKQYTIPKILSDKIKDRIQKQSLLTFLTQLESENIVKVKKGSAQDYKMQI